MSITPERFGGTGYTSIDNLIAGENIATTDSTNTFSGVNNFTDRLGVGAEAPESKFHARDTAISGIGYIGEATGIIEGVDGCLELASNRAGSYASTLALTSSDGTTHNNWAIVNGGSTANGRLRLMYSAIQATTLGNINQEFMSVSTTGNVGIGTTSPFQKAHIADSGNARLIIQETTGGTGATAELLFQTSATQTFAKGAIIWEDTGLSGARGNLHLCVNNSGGGGDVTKSDARLTVQNDGNVGIGTTSPGYKLDVSGNARINAGFVSTNGESSFAAGSTFNTGALVNIGSGFSPGKTLLKITGVDNETQEKAIDIYDENSGNMHYLRSDGTSTAGRSQVYYNASKFTIVNLPTSSAGLSSGDIYRVGNALMIV